MSFSVHICRCCWIHRAHEICMQYLHLLNFEKYFRWRRPSIRLFYSFHQFQMERRETFEFIKLKKKKNVLCTYTEEAFVAVDRLGDKIIKKFFEFICIFIQLHYFFLVWNDKKLWKNWNSKSKCNRKINSNYVVVFFVFGFFFRESNYS